MLALNEQKVRCYSVHLNSNGSYLDIQRIMTPSQLHTHLLFKYTTMAIAHGSVLVLIEYMERYIVLALDEQKVRWYLLLHV